MADTKLRCALVYRLQGSTPDAICLAKFDHAGQYESHGGAGGSLYGGKDSDYANAVGMVISNDPPGGLSETGRIGGFKVVQSDQHQVIYGADTDGNCFAVVTGLSYPSRVAIVGLEELSKEFTSSFKSDMRTGAENALTKKGKKILSKFCTKYETPEGVDKTRKILGQVDAVKSQMQDNIAGMLKNTEAAEQLGDKASQLGEQASVFKKRSKDLKKKMWWKNMKMTLILGGIVVVILLVVLVPLIVRAKNLVSHTSKSSGGGGEAGEGP